MEGQKHGREGGSPQDDVRENHQFSQLHKR